MSCEFIDTQPVPSDCKRCNGTGMVGRPPSDPDWCMECGGVGCDWLDRSALFTLAHNLAVAGALCAAFDLGGPHRSWVSDRIDGYEYDEPWHPGCNRPAGGT